MQESANKDEMAALEENAAAASSENKKENVDRNIMFVRGETQSKTVEEAQRTQLAENPDEIDIDDDDDDDNDDENGDDAQPVERNVGNVEKQAIPAEVFGSLKKDE